MTADQTEQSANGKWRRRALVWMVCVGGLLALLAWSLHRRANPWELEFTIPSGFSEADYRGVGTDMRSGADLSPDGRMLAIAKADGQCDIWDMAQLKRVAVLGDASYARHDSNPALYGAEEVQWRADGRGAVVRLEDGFQLLRMDGLRQPLDAPKYGYTFAVSPAAPLLAVSDRDTVRIIDLESGRAKYDWKTYPVNGDHARLDWTRDGHYLLLNDRLGIWVWDVWAGKELFHHGVLDFGVSPAVPLKDLSRIDGKGPRNLASLVDSRFSPDGTYLCAIYMDKDSLWGGAGQPNALRARFYATATGAFLWEALLPNTPRAMAFSADGSRLHVIAGIDFRHSLLTYDTARRQLLSQADCSFISPFRLGVVPLADGRTLAGSFGNTVLFSPTGQYAAFSLNGSPNPNRVIPVSDGRLIEVGLEKTVRIWRQRRESSIMGAFALSETWAIYILSIGLLIGIVLIGVRDATREFGQRIPQPLCAAAILACVCLGGIVGNRIVAAAVGNLYDVNYGAGPRFDWIDWTILIGFVAGIVGTMRLSRGWWLFMQVALLLAALLIASLAGRLAWELRSGTGTTEAVEGTLHGWPIRVTPALTLAFMILELILLTAEAFLLMRGEVRTLFQRSRFLDPSEPSAGFPLN